MRRRPRPKPRSQANSRLVGPPLATARRTPWNKSSLPHSLIERPFGPDLGPERAIADSAVGLRDYFGAGHKAELPVALAECLDSGAPTLQLRIEDRQVTVERSNDALLLEETRDELGVTPREREILDWVARGGTNSEIAEALWISPATVRKHLENINTKLGVHTRTAAVSRFLGTANYEARHERAMVL